MSPQIGWRDLVYEFRSHHLRVFILDTSTLLNQDHKNQDTQESHQQELLRKPRHGEYTHFTPWILVDTT